MTGGSKSIGGGKEIFYGWRRLQRQIGRKSQGNGMGGGRTGYGKCGRF